MIYYDSHKWWQLVCVRKGSVFPQAVRPAILMAIVTYLFKYFETQGHFNLEELGLVGNSAVYSGYSFTLGFILVFRTRESYNRFWVSATSVNAMKTQWFEAASSLVVFIEMSKGPPEKILEFKHRIVRLFSLLNASALAAIAAMEDENFPIIDINSWEHADLEVIFQKKDVEKAETIYRWIQAVIVQCLSSSLINMPPPILTRVFQQMEIGMVNFNLVMQIMTIPFPFPYAQVTIILNLVYMVFTPLVMATWSSQPWSAAIFTFISIVCVYCVDLIATELENPFGDDTNDLPVHEFHNEFNSLLILLLEPALRNPPELKRSYEKRHDVLLDQQRNKRNLSLNEFMADTGGGGNDPSPHEKKDLALPGSVKRHQMAEEQDIEAAHAAKRHHNDSTQEAALTRLDTFHQSHVPAPSAPSAPAPHAAGEDELINKLVEKMCSRLQGYPLNKHGGTSQELASQGLGGGGGGGQPSQPLDAGSGHGGGGDGSGGGAGGGAGIGGDLQAIAGAPWQEILLQRQEVAQKEFLAALNALVGRIDAGTTPMGRQEGDLRLRHGRGTSVPPCCG